MTDMSEIHSESASFCKEAFLKIPAEKQERIIKAAMIEFAQNGLIGANVNIIAKKAGISIGSLYNYFERKEDIFLTIAHKGLETMVGSVMVALSFGENVFNDLKLFIKVLIHFIQEQKELALLYNDVAYAKDLDIVESASKYAKENLMEIYRNAILAAQDKGIMRRDIDIRILIFYLDAIFSAIRIAYTTDDENSLGLFIGNNVKNDIDYFTDQLVALIKPSLLADKP